MAKIAYAIFKEDSQDPHALTLGRLIKDNLNALSANPQSAKSLWVMLESAAEFHFDWFDHRANWSDWAAGRIFGAKGELRFWRRGAFVHAVLLTDDGKARLQHFEKEQVLNEHQAGEASEYLWRGKPDKATDSFTETRLPRDLKYPVPQPTMQPKLKAKTYTRNGVPEFVRFCEVVG